MTSDKIVAPSRATKLCGTNAADPPARRFSAGAAGFEQAAASLHALNSLKRSLDEAELNLDAYAVARVEAEK